MLQAIRLLTAAFIAAFVAPNAALSQDTNYPTQAVTVIVPTSAGSYSDAVIRKVSETLRQKWNQQIIVENRTGGGGAISAEAAHSATPDSHTLLFGISSTVVNSILDENMNYKLHVDFQPISRIGVTQQILVVPSSLGISDLSDLQRVLGGDQDLANFGSVGTLTSIGLFGANLSKELELDAQEIPFRGSLDIITELVAGRLGYAFVDAQTAFPFIRDGQLKVIAVGGPERLAVLPDAPTLAELGLTGFEPVSWFGLFAPRDTPADIVAQISRDLNEAVESEEISEWLRTGGAEPSPTDPEEFRSFIEAETSGWVNIATNVGLEVKD